MTRRASRVDGNHAEICTALRAVGALVFDTSRVGDGFPDIVVGVRGRFLLIEVKNAAQPKNKQRLRPGQKTVHALCQAKGLPCVVVHDVREALIAVGVRFDDEGPRC